MPFKKYVPMYSFPTVHENTCLPTPPQGIPFKVFVSLIYEKWPHSFALNFLHYDPGNNNVLSAILKTKPSRFKIVAWEGQNKEGWTVFCKGAKEPRAPKMLCHHVLMELRKDHHHWQDVSGCQKQGAVSWLGTRFFQTWPSFPFSLYPGLMPTWRSLVMSPNTTLRTLPKELAGWCLLLPGKCCLSFQGSNRNTNG